MAEQWTKTQYIPELQGGLKEKWYAELEGLDVEGHAIADGGQNLPPSDASDLSPTEARIVGVYLQGRHTLADWLREKCDDAAAQIREQLGPRFSATEWINANKASVKAAIMESGQELDAAAVRQDETKRALNVFRARHRLNRPPEVPGPGKMFLAAAIMAFVGALEVALNTGFFAHGRGILEGAFYSIGVSVTNIGLGALAGIVGLRLAINHFLPARIIGFVVLGICTTFAVIANLFYAHAREISESRPEGGFDAQAAGARLLDAPLAIMGSLPLFALGMLIFLIVMIADRASFTDPYWDYAKFGSRAGRAQQQFDEVANEIRESVADELQEREAALEARVASSFRAHAAAKAAHAQAVQRKVDIEDSCEELAHLCRTSVGTYRAKNREVRTDLPGPTYFATPPDLPMIEVSISQIEGLIHEIEVGHRELNEQIAAARDGLAAYRESALQEQIEEALAKARNKAKAQLDEDEAAREREQARAG